LNRLEACAAFLLACGATLGSAAPSPVRADQWTPVALSDSLGPEIDASERAAYHLLSGVQGFVSARFLTNGRSAYRLEYTYKENQDVHESSLDLSAGGWALTKMHVGLVERSRALGAASDSGEPAAWQYRLALEYAAKARYEVARPLLQDLSTEYPASLAAEEADSTLALVNRLAGGPPGIYLPGALYDRSGRTDLLIFAGYYGVWVGIAAPVWANSDSPQAYAAGLLIAAPASLLLASELTKRHGISQGRATMISLGGNLGTWQGLGWAGLGDGDGNAVVGVGLLSGLAGIVSAVALTDRVHFSEGHAAVTNAGLLWGAWFGFVAGSLGGAEDDGLLRASLIGSDALVLGGGIAARNVRMSHDRMRVITLLGVVGTALGFGVDLLLQPDDDKVVLGIAGAGSVAGLVFGAHATSKYDQGKSLAAGEQVSKPDGLAWAPSVSLKRDGGREGAIRPVVGVRARF
jgi:hypothetical protein